MYFVSGLVLIEAKVINFDINGCSPLGVNTTVEVKHMDPSIEIIFHTLWWHILRAADHVSVWGESLLNHFGEWLWLQDNHSAPRITTRRRYNHSELRHQWTERLIKLLITFVTPSPLFCFSHNHCFLDRKLLVGDQAWRGKEKMILW